jgi:hypothetical protein
MEPASTLLFAMAVRLLGHATRRSGLVMPGFRSPPRVQGVDRTLRRHAGGGVTVAVRLRGRPATAVLSDMIEGVVHANDVSDTQGEEVRTLLWRAVAELVSPQSVESAA